MNMNMDVYMCISERLISDFSLDLAEMTTCLWRGSDHFLRGPFNNPPGPQQEPSSSTLHYLFLQVLFSSFKCRARWWVRVPSQCFFWVKACQRVSYPNRWKSAVIATSVPPKCHPLPSIEAHSVNSNPASTWRADLCPATTTGLSHCRTPTTALSFQMRWLLYSLHLGNQEKRAVGQGAAKTHPEASERQPEAGICPLKTYLTEEELWLFAQVFATSRKYIFLLKIWYLGCLRLPALYIFIGFVIFFWFD